MATSKQSSSKKGASKKPDKWVPRLVAPCELAVAKMANSAGIAGAAQLSPFAV